MSSLPGPEPRPLPNPSRKSVRGLPAIPTQKQLEAKDLLIDFWIPQVTQEGQIYYANTLTGQYSRDLPKEPDEDVEDSAVVGLTTSQSTTRSGTGAELGFVPKSSTTVAPSMITSRGPSPEVVHIKGQVSSSTPPLSCSSRHDYCGHSSSSGGRFDHPSSTHQYNRNYYVS